MRNNKLVVVVFVLGLTFLPCMLHAFQTDPTQSFFDQIGFDDNVNDVPESPINSLVALGMVVASCLGYKKFKK